MTYTRIFKELSKKDVAIAGGKGASLGEMTQASIPVPPGFVILSGAFERFLEETDLNVEIDAILDSVDHAVIHTVEEASEKIRALILQAKMPTDIEVQIEKSFSELDAEFVAVRSSATSEDSAAAAWAGQLDSFLNTTKATVLENVKKCWASLFTPRAIFYRFEKGLHGTDISVAVVVQKMIQSEVSGIAFSVHPVTQDYDQLIIEAGFGLGEAIVSGSITPDSFVIEKSNWNIIDKNITTQDRGLFRKPEGGNEWQDIPSNKGELPTLTDGQVIELAKLIVRIEQHYGFPVDVEWAREGGQFYIVQSRPITTLQKQQKPVLEPLLLSKIFSREKTLFYFSMWNDSDRRGWGNFLGHDVKHNLFIIPPSGRKGSVWYSQKELADVDVLLRDKIKNDPNLITRLTETLDTNWKVLLLYLSDNKKLKSVEEFKKYYDHLVDWWSAMTTAFTVPDMEDVDEDVRNTFLAYRIEAEKYTEKMNKVLVAFWKEHFPKFTDLTFFIAPSEVENFSELAAKIEQRKDGCVMLDGTVYPLERLDSLLKESSLVLEEISTDGVEDIKGTPAYPGKARGQVKKISSFADMGSFKAGEILVTEMTNPDYVPIMKIAAAVVTDEGGATCHAAIASRELKVPCIVGTKIATQVLKDGDMVEVDAQKGVVKILTPKLPDLANYQRLFQFDSFVEFSFSYDFVRGYFDLGGVAFSNQNIWLSYMSQSAIEKTVNDGLELYKSKQKYEDYKKELYQTFQDIEKAIETFETKGNLEKNEAADFFSLIKTYRILYQKTEFFYTDLAFEKKEKFPEIKENFKSFEQFKLDGRDYLNRVFLVPDSFFSRFLKKLSIQFSVSYQDLLSYSIEEFLQLFDGQKVSNDIISERRKGYIVYVSENDIVSIAGEEALKFIEQTLSHKISTNTLTGKIANKGKVTATAKVIKISLSDYGNLSKIIEEMEQGQVLVAETTEPSIIAACKKASAIVTNQGGMMSHAAIVAREMNIPCIVGVTNATEAIQDGDLIEVDADIGMVRILEN